mgnify:CR=1 FL=1
MIVFYKELGFHMSRGRTKPYFVLRHTTSCVTTHDRYFQLPGFPLLYLSCVLYNRLFHESDISSYSILFLPFPPSFFLFFGFSVAFPLYFLCTSLYFLFISLVHTPAPPPPNARVNIIRCVSFPPSSCIREKYVLQHPYNSTL